MTIVLRSKVCKILLRTAKIDYENTYEMHEILNYNILKCGKQQSYSRI